VRPDVILNCVGVIKQLDAAKDARASIYTNALFPHLLAAEATERGARVIHVSTDCVFSGERGSYRETDFADARDLYGRTKLLGELPAPHLTMRTSIVGRELFSSLSLLDWFLSQRGRRVRGFQRAIYSGFSTIALSREIARVISDRPKLAGLYHVSSEPIAKYDLLHLWRSAYGVDIEIEPDDAFLCDRSLLSGRYRADAGFTPPSWPEMVDEMARDATPYARIRGA
jgi:dTDP-4-dehydrorhamnose reductase